MLKKIIYRLALTAVFSASLLPVQNVLAYENEEPQICVRTVDIGDHEDTAVAIELKNDPGIIAVGISISYEPLELELVSVDNGFLFDGADFTAGGDVSAVPYKLMWSDALAKDDHTENGTLAVLHFKVNPENTNGKAEISVELDKKNTFNHSLEDVSFETVGGCIVCEKDDRNHTYEAETTSEFSPDTTDTGASSDETVSEVFSPHDAEEKALESYRQQHGDVEVAAVSYTGSDGGVSVSIVDKNKKVLAKYVYDKTGKDITQDRTERASESTAENNENEGKSSGAVTAPVLIMLLIIGLFAGVRLLRKH
ncbi:Cohesin domain-containing protein [Ruminococcus sp. YRD2003]|uniref:cohesin domain-containing protein n=1 Tax=Ruminococcus sp. YRD2003 TaxID=1452313 RepID=UPI0008D8CB00|nr:Cohesin domain-containing protein [Ruminococcus flavefaciens]